MTQTAAPDKPKTASKTQLLKGAVHEGVTLPSGAVVSVRLPDIVEMIAAGSIPNDLIEAALRDFETEDDQKKLSTEEKLKRTEEGRKFVNFIIPHTLVEPKVSEEEAAKLDPRDKELLVAFATRRTDLDAVGHQLGGLETVKSFRDARGLTTLAEALAGVSGEGDDAPVAD